MQIPSAVSILYPFHVDSSSLLAFSAVGSSRAPTGLFSSPRPLSSLHAVKITPLGYPSEVTEDPKKKPIGDRTRKNGVEVGIGWVWNGQREAEWKISTSSRRVTYATR
jgi:hypothetical protein